MRRRFVVLGSVLFVGTLVLALTLTGKERIYAQQAPREDDFTFLKVGESYSFCDDFNLRKEPAFSGKVLGRPHGHWIKVGIIEASGVAREFPAVPAWIDLDRISLILPVEPKPKQPQPESKGKDETKPADAPEKPADAGFGPAQFDSGVEKIQGVEVKVGDPQFTLTWDTDADLDLHVIEPGDKEIYWEEPKGAPELGGAMDVDCIKGFGPENIFWRRTPENGGKSLRPGPSGEYRWYVIYWGGFGGVTKPTKWSVRIKNGGKTEVVTGVLNQLNERSKVRVLKVEPAEKP